MGFGFNGYGDDFGFQGPAGGPTPTPGVSPLDLGASLLAWWDAETPGTIARTGASVTAWADVKNGYTVSQGTAGAQPQWSATGFLPASGPARAGVQFDGIDDFLNQESVTLPTGAAEIEIWGVLAQAAVSTVNNDFIFAYGTSAAGQQQGLLKQNDLSTGSQNRLTAIAGGAQVINPADFTGVHYFRMRYVGSTLVLSVDNNANVAGAGSVLAGSTRTRIGATLADTPTNFLEGSLNNLFVTTSLTAPQAAAMLGFVQLRAGL